MKKLKFRLILPLLLALVLALGSCMTAYAASSPPVPDDDSYSYYVEIAREGENTPCRIYYFQSKCLYRENIGVCVSAITYYYSDYVDGEWNDLVLRNRGNTTNAFCFCSDGSYTVLYSNHDILYAGSDKVFFRPLLAARARVLPGVVMTHLKVILPAGVGCLALLIGSAVLLPRLRRSLLRL